MRTYSILELAEIVTWSHLRFNGFARKSVTNVRRPQITCFNYVRLPISHRSHHCSSFFISQMICFLPLTGFSFHSMRRYFSLCLSLLGGVPAASARNYTGSKPNHDLWKLNPKSSINIRVWSILLGLKMMMVKNIFRDIEISQSTPTEFVRKRLPWSAKTGRLFFILLGSENLGRCL